METKKSRINEAHALTKGLYKYGPNGISGSQGDERTKNGIRREADAPENTVSVNFYN